MNKENQGAALTTPIMARFSRKATADQMSVIRERLIVSRIMNGFSIEEAHVRLEGGGWDIAKIESGAHRIPKDLDFLRKVADTYAVSLRPMRRRPAGSARRRR